MDIHILKKQMTAAYRYSLTRFTLNYYTYFEMVAEGESISDRLREYTDSLNQLLARFLRNEDVEPELDKLRNQVILQVEILTSYTDCFQIYEYMLNRIERKVEDLPETGCEDEEFTRMLMQFITGSKDSAVMNGRIRQVISQLPVRYTKQKFYSLIREGLSVYIGSSCKSLDDMMYILRSESMVKLPDDWKDGREDLYGILKHLEQLDFKSLDKDAYVEASARLSFASGRLLAESGVYTMLQELINDLYVLVLSSKNAMINLQEQELCADIIGEVLNKFLSGDTSRIEDSITELLVQLEGRQESYYERYINMDLTATGEEKADERMVKIEKLLSGSSFAELQEPDEPDDLADNSYLEQTVLKYVKELDELFVRLPRPLIRSVMAKVLSSLPVFFNSVDEVQNYICSSMENCTDPAEKETCKELLIGLMETENALV